MTALSKRWIEYVGSVVWPKRFAHRSPPVRPSVPSSFTAVSLIVMFSPKLSRRKTASASASAVACVRLYSRIDGELVGAGVAVVGAGVVDDADDAFADASVAPADGAPVGAGLGAAAVALVGAAVAVGVAVGAGAMGRHRPSGAGAASLVVAGAAPRGEANAATASSAHAPPIAAALGMIASARRGPARLALVSRSVP